MAARRRKTRYTWLPTLGTAGPGEDPTDNSSGRAFTVTVPADLSSDVIISAITFDEPLEGDNLATNTPLGTVLGNEYFIKRIVGKLFAEIRQQVSLNGDPSFQRNALFGAGFFVARANDTSQGAGSPIGSATLSERQENYSPLSEDTIREPWIWRRTWVLGNQYTVIRSQQTALSALPGDAQPFGWAPQSTMQYGSVLDGPHIDAKTARRVKQDERLWFAVAARGVPGLSDTTDLPGSVNGYLDFRILGALRKARQGSAF